MASAPSAAQSNRAAQTIGIGGSHYGRAPATPPGVRDRTGRFERLRLAESGGIESVEVGNGQHPVQRAMAVTPPTVRVRSHLTRHLK